MKIIITGGSGFIGRHLMTALIQRGHEVTILDMYPPPRPANYTYINLARQEPAAELLNETDAIIHLAGRNIFGRWSAQTKKEIYQSRIESTKNLLSLLKKLPRKPKIFISASAVGIYGDRGEEELDECSSLGNDFLAKVCIDWEKEARKVEALGIRSIQIRTAPVLGCGGLLDKLLPIYKLGLGGPIGSGLAWFPWIHIEDIVAVYIFALENEKVHGPVNACSPQRIRNKDFSDALASVLKKPAFLRVPRWALKLIFNDLADAITASQKVSPKKLIVAGYMFRFPDIKKALENILQRKL